MKSFDKKYFDKWYRHAAHRVRTRADLQRRVAMAIAVAEYVLERPVRRVLDIGAGEGEWSMALRRMRPTATYVGLEPSAYAVSRYGRKRGIRPGSLGTLQEVRDLERFDLVVCADVMHYIPDDEVTRGIRVLGRRLNGIALLHAFTRGDVVEGDVRGMHRRPERWYRDLFRRASLTHVGLGCWAGRPLRGALAELETSPVAGNR